MANDKTIAATPRALEGVGGLTQFVAGVGFGPSVSTPSPMSAFNS